MKHAVGTRVKIIAFDFHPEFIGLEAVVERTGGTEYLVTMDDGSESGIQAFVTEESVKIIE